MTTVDQRSFAGGEISPSLGARVDQIKYQTGLKSCRNNLVMRYGGSASRPGTTYVANTKNMTGAIKLVPFIQSQLQSYALEFGNNYVRFYQNGAQITLSSVVAYSAGPALATAWAGGTVYSAGSSTVSYQNINYACLSGHTSVAAYPPLNDTRWFPQPNNIPGDVRSSGGINYVCILAHTSKAPTNTTYWYAMPSNILELPTPYASADLALVKYVQSVNKMFFAHSTYPPQVLTRISAFSWSFLPMVFQPTLPPPNPCLTAQAGSGVITYSYAITGVDSSGNESLPFFPLTSLGGAVISVTNPMTVSIGFINGGSATTYNIYRKIIPGTSSPLVLPSGDYSFVGSCQANEITGGGLYSSIFLDSSTAPDPLNRPPVDTALFESSGNYPAVVSLTQQRLTLMSTINQPETVWTSRTAGYTNFNVSSISQADDAVTFTLSGQKLNTIVNAVEMGSLFLFTTCSELQVAGDQNGTITPSSINLKTQSLQGSSALTPIVVDGNMVFVQARGSVVRDLFFQLQIDGYRGNELSIFSNHLIEGYTLVDWAYQQIPHSIIWAVRNDGILLGLTYVKDQQIVAWHRHDFSGTLFQATVENVCSIPEAGMDALYIAVRRFINGQSVLMIERMASRLIANQPMVTSSSTVLPWPNLPVVDYIGVDCSLAFDGRNQGAMTISGGTLWDYTETLTLTSTNSVFVSGDVGHQFVLNQTTSGPIIRFTVTSFTSASVVLGNVDRTVPVSWRSVSLPGSSRAVKTVTGLDYLDGENVSILADGFVVGSPLNPNYPVYTVASGSLTLDACYSVIRVGLPITCDLQTLSVDTPQGESIVNQKKIVPELTLLVEKSMPFFAGQLNPDLTPGQTALAGLVEVKSRHYEPYDVPINLHTGPEKVTIETTFDDFGSVFIRQVDPVPLSVLSIAGDGLFPFKGG